MKLTEFSAYKHLRKHALFLRDIKMLDLFERDKNRADKFSVKFGDEIFFDYSKNLIDDKGLEFLLKLAEQAGVEAKRDAMFRGDKINGSENRAVLHTALRNMDSSFSVKVDGKDVMPGIRENLAKVKMLSEAVREGNLKGITGKRILDVVCVGVGGFYVGAKMVLEALKNYSAPIINVHFIANIDGTEAKEVLKILSPETTLFVVIDKSFTTDEAITNAEFCRKWVERKVSDVRDFVKRHFIAVTSNARLAKEFGILESNVFNFGDFVGKNFSLWSPAGAIPIALSIGFDNFVKMLKGAYHVDQHFLKEPMNRNIPIVMALLSVWYINFWDVRAEAVVPYDSYMKYFPVYLQSLSMASNAKSLTTKGEVIDYMTASVMFGDVGTNAQYSFFQMLYQGTQVVPVDFVVPLISHNEINNGINHRKLIANALAQAETLMKGETKEEVLLELKDKDVDYKTISREGSFRVFEGNKPSNMFLINEITPENLGKLIALYEHKVFVEGMFWDINPFDQFGVEFGREFVRGVEKDFEGREIVGRHDASTEGLIKRIKSVRKNYD